MPTVNPRQWVSRHPYASIVGFTVTAGWAAIGLPILASRGVLPGAAIVDSSPIALEKTVALVGMAVMLAGALWMARLADGPDRLALTAERVLRWRIGWSSWMLAAAVLPVTTIATGVVFGRSLDLSPAALLGQIGSLVVAVIAINLAEEAMWAGLVQSRLEVRHRLPTAALLTAVPFALLHVPLRFVEAEFTIGAALGELLVLLVLGFVVRLLFALALRNLGDSLLALAVFHASFNSANNEDGIGAAVLGADHQGFALLAVLVVLAALVVLARGRLGRRDARDEHVSPKGQVMASRTAATADPMSAPDTSTSLASERSAASASRVTVA